MKSTSPRWRIVRWGVARWSVTVFGLGLGLRLGFSCAPANTFVCSLPHQCGSDGTCESIGYCSFPDPDCSSGRRFGDHASAELAGTCVELDDVPMTSGSSGSPPEPATGTSSPMLDTGFTTEPVAGTAEPDPGSTGLPIEGTSTTGSPDMSTGIVESTGSGISRVTEGLLVLYRFDEGSGTTVADQGGYGEPLDLTIESATMQSVGFHWQGDGLAFEDAVATSIVPATKVIEACQATGELTAEAWVTPATKGMTGPGRILTVSDSGDYRDFTLGQGHYVNSDPVFVGRVRTSNGSGSLNGTPELVSSPVATTNLTHLAYVRTDDGHDRIYIDGQLHGESTRTGSFSNWNESYVLSCGNEPTLDRPWQGVLHLVAVYDHALTLDQIEQNIDAGF
ncbi:MAG: LamG domain-containing protein [Myxococcota bacterium]